MASQNNNLIIGQSGGATAVINASLVGAVEAALADERIDGIYGMMHGIEGFLKEDLSGDGLHPNEKGYTVMAPLAEQAIAAALKKKK